MGHKGRTFMFQTPTDISAVAGGGTTNAVAKFTGQFIIGDSSITDDGTVVTFSTTTAFIQGSATSPSITHTSSTGTGLFWTDSGGLGVTGSGSQVGVWSSSGLVVGPLAQTDGLLQVMSGTAGSVTPDTNSDEIVVEGAGHTGITLASPNGSNSQIYFASPGSAVGCLVRWNYTANQMTILTNRASASIVIASGSGGTAQTIDGNQRTAFSGYIGFFITDSDSSTEGDIWYDASEDKLKFKTAAGVETITSA